MSGFRSNVEGGGWSVEEVQRKDQAREAGQPKVPDPKPRSMKFVQEFRQVTVKGAHRVVGPATTTVELVREETSPTTMVEAWPDGDLIDLSASECEVAQGIISMKIGDCLLVDGQGVMSAEIPEDLLS